MRTLTKHPFVLIFCFIFFTFSPRISIANDTITSIQSLKDDGQTLVSAGQVFELGFFSPGNSKKNRYIGIWYKNISTTVVWVANRGKPISNSDGVLTIGDDGNLVLSNRAASVFWSSNRSSNPMDISNTFAQLLDNGNLVVIDGNDHNSESFLWQSFDYPSDTLLPGMKLGWDLRTGLNRFLTSWASADDPSPGAYSFKIDPNGSPQVFLWKGADRIYRSGPWNGFQFSGVPEMKPNFIFHFEFVTNQDEVYYRFELYPNVSAISRLLVNNTGLLQRFTWQDQARGWNFFWSAPKDQCDDYKECGPYGFCNNNLSPICQCVKGFQPKSPQEWYFRDGSNGCVRKTPLDCRKGDGFYKLTGMKLPDTSHSLVDQSKSLKECEDECLKNCSCMAYASANVTGGSGCVIWDGDLIDLRQYTTDGGQDLYVRLASSELDEGGNVESSQSSRDNKKQVIVIVASVVIPSMIIVLLLSGLCVWKRKTMKSMLTRKAKTKPKERGGAMDYSGECREEELELPLFDFYTIKAATNNFSDENKIGEGGFGCVYKGSLTEGQEIAVKRLSKTSGQGLDEFKNEVILIAKLQHRNLVRLLGCSIEGEEKMLIYEYMKNGSLDSFIFDKTRSAILDWPKRFQIISGIARGLLYLHQDSRFRIIHRDLKAGNILLDNEMYPKISDFGMARIFGADQTEANTRRIVGTYGYMSPEYAIDGLFSVKSDVFSFGVLVLEIISALKNRGFKNYDHNLNLLGHAWKLWKERKGSEMIDQSMDSVSYSLSEVLRCIHVGLLCVQELAEDRPTMSSVVLMLGSASAVLPQPKAPGFCTGRSVYGTDSSSAKMETSCTVNDMTITMLEAR